MASSARVAQASSEFPHRVSAGLGRYLALALTSGEKLFDFTTVVAALYGANALSSTLRMRSVTPRTPPTFVLAAGGFALLFVFLLERHGGYRSCLSLLAIRETERVLRVTLQTFSLALVTAYLFHAGASRLAIAFAVVLVPLFLTLEKWQVHNLLCQLRSRGFATQRAVIVGTGSSARRIYTSFIGSPGFGIEPVAFVEEDPLASTTQIYECSYTRKHSARVLPGPLSPELLQRLGASVLIVAHPAMAHDEMLQTMTEAAAIGIATYFAAEDFIAPGFWVDYAELDGIILAHFSRGTTRTVYEAGKRILDAAISAMLVALLAPIAAVIVIMVKSTSKGPVLFRQQRIGQSGRPFTMYKFRTMYVEAPQYGYSPGQDDDPRITPVGRLLRRTSLDEFPQLFNVLLGQMSLVGPRPEMPFIVEQYTPVQRERLSVKPGMTGLWQISADRAFLIHENMEYDLYYYRVNIVWLEVPALRKRREDIEPLSLRLLADLARRWGRQRIQISASAMAALESYSWPGNIRELRNVLERALVLAESDMLRAEHLEFRAGPALERFAPDCSRGTLKQMERAYIAHVLHAEHGSIERTARRLGIPRSSLYNKMRRLDIPQGTGRACELAAAAD